jgi:hypothetical protein
LKIKQLNLQNFKRFNLTFQPESPAIQPEKLSGAHILELPMELVEYSPFEQ